jgi:hypothetical protein
VSVAGKFTMLKHAKCCAGKVRHPSAGAAEAHLRSLAKTDSRPMAVYRCTFCKHWHVGHNRYGGT